MERVEVSIIIVNFNTFELTCACIDSLYASQTAYSYEIILVDNASTECPPNDFLKRYPNIVLLTNNKNVGFGIANNQGMAQARGAYFWLLNSDTEVGTQVLERALNTLLAEQADLYSCAQVLGDGRPFFYKKSSFELGHSLRAVWYSLPLYHLSYFSKQRSDQVALKEIATVNTISGAFMLLRRAVYETTKGFDPDFFLYSEETEWCYNRIRKQYKIIYDPHNVFVHKQGSSSPNQSMAGQQFVSTSLGYYKRGYGTYLAYLFLQYGVALPMNGGFYLISKKAYKNTYLEQAKLLLRHWKYLFWDIPRFSNRYAARKKFLRVKALEGK
jgi:GT2 family glycosyltransferase